MDSSVPSETVVVSQVVPGVVRLTLNRPKALNAINVDLLDSLVTALRQNANARVIILEGAGERAFCAGEDLKQTLAPRTGGPAELREAFLKLQEITRLTSSASPLVIAAVQGFAVGGGAEIALAADFVIGGPGARFRFPEASIGQAVTGGISLRLPHLVGLLKAKQLLLTGRFVGAEEALKIGLLTEIADNAKARATELALELVQRPAVAAIASKTSLERAVFPGMEGCLHDEVNVASYCFAQSDATEAFANFATRRAAFGGHPRDGNGVGPKSTDDGEVDNAVKDINSAWSRVIATTPERVFLRFAGKDHTFSEFDRLVADLAGGLRHLGVGMGDHVLVMMKNSVEMVCSWLAANRLGAVWVPVNTQLKSVTLAHVVRAAQPKLAIVDEDLFANLSSVDTLDPSLIWKNGDSTDSNVMSRLFTLGDPVSNPVPVSASTTAAFLYTSGTTGKSKPCMLSHGYFISQARTLMSGCGLNRDDVLFCPFPLFHADATALTVIPAMLLGATAALAPRFSASGFWEEIRASRATVYDFMGATLALTYKRPPSARDREHTVRLAWGVPIPSFAAAYEARFGHSLITLYGSLEAALPIFQDPHYGPLPTGSCGRVRPGYELRIANDADEEVPTGTAGQMLLRAKEPHAFFDGYFNEPQSTLATFRNLWLHTGDIGRVDAHGNVFFLGRIKDVIRRRGENVNAAEVEEEFLRHDSVEIAVAHGIPSELGEGTEEDVKVVVKLRHGSPVVNERELWMWAVEHMARYQVPSVVQIVDEVQKTPTGKLQKHGLNAEGGQRFDIRSVRR
jgi:acyl-CoA synthetase (AMP-forming)/AMP-acid ligase II/enoyl-CoA hydratase/carnithine racemase